MLKEKNIFYIGNKNELNALNKVYNAAKTLCIAALF